MNALINVAREFGALETIDINNVLKAPKRSTENQIFSYLLVLDFEATCWNKADPDKGTTEIIEFPAVLYDVEKNAIVAEFQQYVMPLEFPTLSSFCSELTGIHQEHVEKGVPLPTCLMIFQKWLNLMIEVHSLEFALNDSPNIGKNKCAFVTWSDWDLGVCLKNECKRKRIQLVEIFSKWIDLRATYIKYYTRPLNGLQGALNSLGLNFEGNPHCGLHDARNTAILAGRMIANGIQLRLTRF